MTVEAPPSEVDSSAPEDAVSAVTRFARFVAPARRGFERAWIGARRNGAATGRLVARIFARLWSTALPVLRVVSPAGWVIAALAAGMTVVGLALAWEELLFVGLVLGSAFVVAAAFIIGRSTYAVTIELNPSRVVVGGRARGRLAILNNGARGLLPSRMELPIGEGVAEFGVPSLKPGAEHDEFFAVPTHRRAVIVAGPAVSVRGDQLGIFRRIVRWTDPVDLFVHPITTPIQPSAAGLVRDLEGQVTKKITNNDISFHALREYVPGDDRRYIHWRTSARTGTLMVRQFQETRRSQVTMLLSENVEDYATPDEFELAVSVAASVAVQVIRDGTKIHVVSDSRRLRTHSPVSLLDDSCRVDLRTRTHRDARTWARVTTSRLPEPSVLMIVGGAGMELDAYRGIESLFPADTTVLGFRVIEGARSSLRRVSRMQMLTVGSLSDLAPLLRKAAS